MTDEHQVGEGHHIVPPSTYVTVFLVLLFFTGLTAGISFLDLGPFNTLAALIIATTKMTLVMLFFMQLRFSPRLTVVTVLGAFFWLGILITLALNDYITRGPGWLRYG